MNTPTHTPPPLYGCANEWCREQYSWPAEDLQWVSNWKGSGNPAPDFPPEAGEGNGGWFCGECTSDAKPWDDDADDYIEPDTGPTLGEWLERGES